MLESNGFKRILLLASVLVTYSSGAAAPQVVNQVLEEVIVATDMTALLADFEDTPELTLLDVTAPASNIKACKKTAKGLFCLVGNEVRHWASLDELSTPPAMDEGEVALDCTDENLVSDLNLDTKKSATCTAMTANHSGSVLWLGAKNKGKTHTLFKAVLKSGACPDGWTELKDYPYCAKQATTGRPLLVKIFYLDGNLGLGPGVLMLEERKTAAVWNEDDQAVTEIASGKSDWNLIGNEQLLSIAATSWNDAPYILATTTKDRMLAVDASAPDGFAVFDFVTHRDGLGTTFCGNGSAQHYDVSAGTDSGVVFGTDQNYCLVMALALGPSDSNEFELTATKTLTDLLLPPSYVTSGPGISVNLADCAGNAGCELIKNAATLTNVQLVANSPTGMTLFQIVGIPDCRYIPTADGCEASLVIGPAGDPAAQQLNVTPLIPDEVINAVEDPLPPLLISRQYRGQYQNGFYFDALFGVTEQGVQFQGVFNGEFFVEELTGGPGIGSELGCHLDLPPESPLLTGDLDNEPFGTLEWDIVTTVSENFVSGTGPDEHRDTLINTGCGSSKTSDGRWSMKSFNLEVTPCTYNPIPGDVWASDGLCATGVQGTADDAVFAKLLFSLYDDLGKALNEVACADVDHSLAFPGDGTEPLSLQTCGTLNATFANGNDKLDKCWDATQQPKQSAGSQNCQAFVSQLTNFSNTLAGAPQNPNDVANRKAELQVRVEVLFHVYFERFEPSIPANGFCEPGNPLWQLNQDCTP